MAAWFLDSSAVVKRYVSETGTGWVLTLTDPAAGNDLYVASVTGVEVVSALTRRGRGGSLTQSAASAAVSQFQHDFANQYQTVQLTDAVADRAMALAEAHALRAYGAVQLAAALELNAGRRALGLPPLTLVSADHDLNAAATTEGLPVEDPNARP